MKGSSVTASVFADLPLIEAPSPLEKVKLGSDAHKALFCAMLLNTHDPYNPAVIDWPALDEPMRSKVVSLPVWDMAVRTEEKAGMNVKSYGERITDSLLKKAVEMDAFAGLTTVCLEENDRRLGQYDPRLIRPRFVPNMLRLALKFMPKSGGAPLSASGI
jgi:hypothetical protein